MHLRIRVVAFAALAWSLLVAVAPARASSVEPVGARHGMVASTNEVASRIGVAVLQGGGNAVDAAVAVAFALAVVWPEAGNLGGGGFMLIRRADGRSEVIDYRERAPLAAGRDTFLDGKGVKRPEASTVGHRAVAVPGTVAGLALALERHGTRRWPDLIEPARRLAAEGFVVDWALARSLERKASLLARFDETRKVFFRAGAPIAVGERLALPDLAATLAQLQKDGPRAFYEGETGRRIVADMERHGGLVGARDLKEYRPTVREPLRGSYRGLDILTMPPPSSGGVLLLEMLNLLERHPVASLGFHSVDELHLLVEVMRRAYADRTELADADFVELPVRGLVSKRYAESLDRGIDLAHATPSANVHPGAPAPFDAPQTTHFTIVDGDGNVVSNTFTLNGAYGSGVMAAGTGVLLNNEMDDFTTAPGQPNEYRLIQGEKNAIAPRKRPLSTMTPTILLKDGKPYLAVGTPGGPTIANTVLQVVVGIVDFGMNLKEAVDASRIHHQWLPDVILAEPWALTKETVAGLAARGHKVVDKSPMGYFGDVQAILIDPRSGLRLSASDPRMAGVPVGY